MVIHYSQINIILKRKYKYVAGYVTHCDDCVKPWLVIKYSNQIDLQKNYSICQLRFMKNMKILNRYSQKRDRIEQLIGRYFDVEIIHKQKIKI